jgi:2-(1,2-epoxy-1,2-dihydrophenyl)acetyl-CoA isomerase
MSPNIVVRRSGGVVEVCLNRPERKNALLPQMWIEWSDIVEGIERNDADRVLVLSGAGGAFCSGADIAARWAADAAPAAEVGTVEMREFPGGSRSA